MMTRKEIQQIRQPLYRKIIKYLWYAFGAGVLALILLFVGLSFSDLPNTRELEDPRSELASEVYAADGSVLGRYFIENRVRVKYEDLSPHLVHALIATEDARYYKHSGIDMKALGRVFFKTVILHQRSSGGGSTITQQLAKLFFTDKHAKNLRQRALQKLKEWIIATRLERKYTKEEIIAMYLNKFDFLYESDGIKAAAENYFGKEPDSLKIEEAAMLVGMLKNPWIYNPMRPESHEQAVQRRNVVLYQMYRGGYLTKEEKDSLQALPIKVRKRAYNMHNEGLAPYFRGELSKEIQRILHQEDYLKPDGTAYDLYRDGLKIYTTIDPVVQRHMEETLQEHMKKLQKIFNRHWKGMDPWKYKTSETTPAEMRTRKQKLQRMVWESERYRSLSAGLIGKYKKALQDDISKLRLRDVDIQRLISIEKDPKRLTEMQKAGTISENMADNYRRALRHQGWPELRKAWEELQKTAEEVFNKPVEMTVFTYENEEHKKDTVMSPLDSLKYHHNFLQIGSLAVDPATGHVKGWIGGINYEFFKYDHIRSRRQVGSTFKPFIYSTAIGQMGFSPCFQVYDQPQTILPGEGSFYLTEEWTPQNASGKYSGELLTLKDALRKSKNTVSVFLMKQLGSVDPVLELIRNMGIDVEAKYPNGRYVVPRTPSICLGATDLSVYEMSGAYTTFANNGIYNKPVYLLRIEDRNGHTIYEGESYERPALDEKTNYVMVEMLKYAANLYDLKSEAGGKTGTTNDYVDGWFMGITPTLVVGTWVGGEDRWIRFRSITYGQGARMAKPFFRELIKSLENDEESGYDYKARFYIPPGPLGIEMDCSKYEQNTTEDDPEIYDNPESEDLFGDEEGGEF